MLAFSVDLTWYRMKGSLAPDWQPAIAKYRPVGTRVGTIAIMNVLATQDLIRAIFVCVFQIVC